jgi:hypothetical protein
MKYYKYPRTFHLPWSEGATSDDRILDNVDRFIGKKIVVTEKLDGESSSLYNDHLHARSLDSKDHPSRHWMKQFHGQIRADIPDGFRICGENLFAKHSIFYNSLPSYFLAFSVWNDKKALSWEETLEVCLLLNIRTVPVLYEGIWNEEEIKKCWTGKSNYGQEQEGYVVRLASSFYLDDFEKSVVKFVRKNHVTTSKHWMTEELIPNQLHNAENPW